MARAPPQSRGRFATAFPGPRLGDAESADPDVTAAMVVLVDVAPVLLGPLLEHALDCDAGELATRWRQVETTLLGLPVDGAD
ncbi:MAG: hypothetical protein ACJ74F_08995 [Mycobacterium sp.]|uniref:hypothetical protein n=1 Tax=Mycobacterium sp. TaxID=1785 RepID=UPI00389AB9A1